MICNLYKNKWEISIIIRITYSFLYSFQTRDIQNHIVWKVWLISFIFHLFLIALSTKKDSNSREREEITIWCVFLKETSFILQKNKKKQNLLCTSLSVIESLLLSQILICPWNNTYSFEKRGGGDLQLQLFFDSLQREKPMLYVKRMKYCQKEP